MVTDTSPLIMKKFLSSSFFVLMLTLSSSIYGQYVSHYTERDKIKADTLIDKKSGNRFFVDKERIYITAVDNKGNILWRTDPVIDNKIREYRTKRPTLVYFALGKDWDKSKEVIWISYSNTQFGYLDKTNGHFTFEGQD
jgi:hypothetical protein